jgi:hypothetical protein
MDVLLCIIIVLLLILNLVTALCVDELHQRQKIIQDCQARDLGRIMDLEDRYEWEKDVEPSVGPED